MNQIIKIGFGLLLSLNFISCQAEYNDSTADTENGAVQINHTNHAVVPTVPSYEDELKQWERKDTEYKNNIEFFTKKMTDADYEEVWSYIWKEHNDIILNGIIPFKSSKDPLFRKSYEQQRQINAELWQAQRDDWLTEKPKRLMLENKK